MKIKQKKTGTLVGARKPVKISFSVPAELADRYRAALAAADKSGLIIDLEFPRWLQYMTTRIEKAVAVDDPKPHGKGK